jgi:ABC-type phosphate transport system substrate-binding protein
MRKKTLAVAVGALVALAAPASASATQFIGSGSVAAQPVLTPLFAKYKKVTHGKVSFLYTANGGNAGVADVQQGRSQFAGQARPRS